MFEKGTTNYNLPQWEPTEHPDFLLDMNPAYRTIDEKLGQASEVSDTNSKKINVLQETQIAQGKGISDLRGQVNSNVLEIASLQHDMSDAKNNIAKNAAAIGILETDNHTIHEDIQSHLTDYKILLNWAKDSLYKHYVGTLAYDNVTITCSINFIQSHLISVVPNFSAKNSVVVHPGVDLIMEITAEMPGVHNLTTSNLGIMTSQGFACFVLYTSTSFQFVIRNYTSEDITVNSPCYALAACSYSEIETAEEAIRNL